MDFIGPYITTPYHLILFISHHVLNLHFSTSRILLVYVLSLISMMLRP